jgi:hypothetical protein
MMLDLFTVVWGPPENQYVRNFCDVTLPSLLSENNVPAAMNLIGGYAVYADGDAQAAIESCPAWSEMKALIGVEFRPLAKGPWEINVNLKDQMWRSRDLGRYMLIISADWVIGDGSLMNLAEICEYGDQVPPAHGAPSNPILFGFPKVVPQAFADIRQALAAGERVDNRRLVDFWARYGGGGPMTARPYGEKRWLISHRTPTPCLRPDDALINFFSENPTPNQGYDHAIPYWMVTHGYPWHYLADSDLFFILEMAISWTGKSGPWGLDLLSQGDQFFSHIREVWHA